MYVLTILLAAFGLLVGQGDNPYADMFENDALCEDLQGTMVETLERATGLMAEAEDVNIAIFQLQTTLSTIHSWCNGHSFSSEELGSSVVTDPIVFPDGIYRSVLTGAENSSVEMTVIDGECGDGFFYIREGGEVQTSHVMESCTTLLTIDSRGEWELVFEPILVGGE